MGKYEVIRKAIDTIDGGVYQALASHYVRHKFHVAGSYNLGMSAGTTKTAPGTPDSFLLRDNGHLLFMECGHVSDHGKALAKLQKDVNACLNKEQRDLLPKGIPLDFIVCCFSYGRFEAEELAVIEALDERIRLIGPDEIATVCYERYPWLAKDYLDVAVGSGSFLDLESFLKRSDYDQFTPSMRQQLIGREEETEAVQRLIEHNQAVLVSGQSGCGKTRLSIEVCKRISTEDESDIFVVPSTKVDLYEDLRTICSADEPTILLLDDANELAGLKTIVDFVLERPFIKLIVTARNYEKNLSCVS